MSAARELVAGGLNVVVLEARDRVGGRTLTKVVDSSAGEGSPTASSTGSDDNTANGQPPKDQPRLWCDLGGSYVGPSQDNVLNLIDELKLKTYLVDDSLDIGYMKTTSDEQPDKAAYTSRFHPSKDIQFGTLLHWLDYVNLVRLLDQMGAEIPSEAPWLAPKAREWDSITFKQFIDNTAWTSKVADFFTNIFLPIDVCSESNEISLLWFLWYTSQCGGIGRTIATTNGGQERKVDGGTQQLSQRLVTLINANKPASRCKLLLRMPVCYIKQQQRQANKSAKSNKHHEQQQIEVGCLGGRKFVCDRVILAIAPHLWLKIHFEPSLPRDKLQLAQRSPMGCVGKVILYYDKPFWKDHNYSGCFLIDSARREKHPIILSLDETKPDGSQAAIIGFCGARGWHEMRNKSDLEVGQIVAQSYCLATAGLLKDFLAFKRVERFDWTSEQYSGGCYGSVQGPNTLTKFGPSIRQPVGGIYFAGTETATKWSGYMDGAISAGKRAAREVLFASGKLANQDDIWRHQEPPRPDNKPFEYPASYKWAPSVGASLAALGALSACLLALGVGFALARVRQ